MSCMRLAPRNSSRCAAALACVLLGAALPAAPAQPAPGAAPPGATPPASPPPAPPTTVMIQDGAEMSAKRLEFDLERRSWVATGNVVMRYKDMELQADHVTYHPLTQDVEARGGVLFKRPGMTARGEHAWYNLRTRTIDTARIQVFVAPFYVRAQTSRRREGNAFSLNDAIITTCKVDPPDTHWHIRAREAIVTPGERVEAHDVTFYMGKVPVMHVPRWTRNAGEDTGFNVVPGYTSLMGAFLLMSYDYRLTPLLKAQTRLDYRTRRGLGIGQEFRWRDPDLDWYGRCLAYYADDQYPNEDDEDPELEEVDSNRHRLALRHTHHFDDRTYLLSSFDYLSDPDVLEDFFADAYREGFQPDNFVSLTRRGRQHAMGLLLRKRLNDFYTSVDRVPELSLELSRQPLGATPLFYEGRTTLASVEKAWESAATNDDYAVFRFDCANEIHYPHKYWGFLNLIPRLGYRLTYYSKTVETNALTGVAAEGSAGTRSLYELGAEMSFKAFKAWGTVPRTDLFDGLRHVAQPYADYAYVPEPNLAPAELYPFDSVDTLSERNRVRFGMRNKLQTRRAGRVHDLADVDLYTTYHLESDDDTTLDDLVLDAELRVVDWLSVDFDSRYNPDEGALEEFNTQIAVKQRDDWQLATEYRFRDDEILSSSLLAARADYRLNRSEISEWSVGAGLRYELDDSRLEEHSYSLQRRMDCMVAKLGVSQIPAYTRSDGTERDDEFKVWLEVWLTAFPKVGLSVGR
ncbi:MAG: LPS-assembly protein LptD [Kiritimatiellae bacterium]|nr:LPS-assembly protein LptD [Kiritimatiellia bacterium]